MIAKANQQVPTLDEAWTNFLTARHDIIVFLRNEYGYSNYQLAQTLNMEIDAVDVIVKQIEAEDAADGKRSIQNAS